MHILPSRVGGVALIFALTSAVPSWAAEIDEDGRAPLSPDAAVAATLEIHSQVRSAASAVQTAKGERREVGLFLYNPQVSGQYSLPGGARTSLSVTQPLSLSGEGWFARGAASARLDASEAWLDRSVLVAAADTRQAYIDAVVAVGRVKVAKDGVALVARLRHAVTRQQEEGEASMLALRLARMAEVHASTTLLEARETEADALSALAQNVGRPVTAEALVTDPLAAVPVPTVVSVQERSDVVSARETLRAAEAELRRQRAATLPVISVGVSIQGEDGQSFIGPTGTMTVPLFGRNQKGRSMARGQVDVAEAGLASVTARAQTEGLVASRRANEAQEIANAVITDPVADAQAALASVEAGYLAGEIDLPSTVLLQREVLEGQSAAIEMLGRIGTASLDLMLVTEDPALLGGAR